MPTLQKIRYSDCDPQGIVFNGNYARYWDDALTDWLEERGYGGPELGGAGVEIVTARIEMDFKASATLGDTLETTLTVESFGVTSVTMAFVTSRVEDAAVLTSGREVLVFVDPTEFKPIRVPENIKDRLSGESD